MNITLAIDEQLAERAREVARQQGTSLNALIREYLERLAGQPSGDELLAQFERLWSQPGRSDGRTGFDRDEVYDDRVRRYPKRT
jgi:hypothetical protein